MVHRKSDRKGRRTGGEGEQEGKEKSISGKSSHPVMPHMLWEEEHKE